MGRDHIIRGRPNVFLLGNHLSRGDPDAIGGFAGTGDADRPVAMVGIDAGLTDMSGSPTCGLTLGLAHESEVTGIGYPGSLDAVGARSESVLEAFGSRCGIGKCGCLDARVPSRGVERLQSILLGCSEVLLSLRIGGPRVIQVFLNLLAEVYIARFAAGKHIGRCPRCG